MTIQELTDELHLGWLFGGSAIATAIWAVWRVMKIFQDQGAKAQQLDDRVARLEQARASRDAKIDKISETLTEMKIESERAHSEIKQRLVKLETTITNFQKRD